MKCRETSKHPLHHPHFPGHSPDQSTGPSSFWNIPHSHRSQVPMPICRTRHTSNREHTWRAVLPPELTPPSSSSTPLHPYLGPRAGAAPGAQQGTTCSAVWTEESWLVRARPGAELVSQTWKGRSSLRNNMQIPWWGQRCGQSQERWEGSTFSKVK